MMVLAEVVANTRVIQLLMVFPRLSLKHWTSQSAGWAAIPEVSSASFQAKAAAQATKEEVKKPDGSATTVWICDAWWQWWETGGNMWKWEMAGRQQIMTCSDMVYFRKWTQGFLISGGCGRSLICCLVQYSSADCQTWRDRHPPSSAFFSIDFIFSFFSLKKNSLAWHAQGCPVVFMLYFLLFPRFIKLE